MNIRLTQRNALQLYDRQAKNYAETHNAGSIEEILELIMQLRKTGKEPIGTSVLDVGCGSGVQLGLMRKRGLDAIGMDASLEMCNLVRKRKLPIIRMDFRNLAFKNEKFDVVWAKKSLVHAVPALWLSIINNLCDLLRENGILYIECKESLDDEIREEIKNTPTWHAYYCYWPMQELMKMLEEGCPLRILKIYQRGLDRFGERHYVHVFARKI